MGIAAPTFERGPAPVTPPTASTAGGNWQVDEARAQQDAKDCLNAIDWSRRDIVIYVPGTGEHAIDGSFRDAIDAAFRDNPIDSLVLMDYEASWRMRPSIATGLETLRLVLAGIAAHPGDHTVLLAGLSQGAWLIGEAMSHPTERAEVTRAVLLGHPWLAAHQYRAGQVAKVDEIDHAKDPITAIVHGNLQSALTAMCALHTGQTWSNLGTIIPGLLANPMQGVDMLEGILRSLGLAAKFPDHHDYDNNMAAAVHFLLTGVRASDVFDPTPVDHAAA